MSLLCLIFFNDSHDFHSINKNLLSPYYVPGTMLCPGGGGRNDQGSMVPSLIKLIVYGDVSENH